MSLIKKIIIFGDNEHAWFSAAMLAFNCPWLNISVIGEKESDEGFYAAATRSGVQRFFGSIGLPWQELLFSCGATYKLANQYVNCGKNNHDFFHSDGVYGADNGLFEFHQIIKALDPFFPSENYDAYSLEAQSAKSGKFVVNHNGTWGLHYERIALSHLLKIYAQKLGVISISEKTTAIDFCDTTDTKVLISADGVAYDADFYIDARRVNLAALNENDTDNSSWLGGGLSDWCLTAHLDDHKIYLPTTQYRRIDSHYWLKKISLQSKTVVELYGVGVLPPRNYSVLFNALGYSVNADSIRLIEVNSGRRKSFWSGNCLFVGEASVASGNLAFPALDITKFQMEKFLNYFPEKEQNYNLIAEYNRVGTQAVDDVLDYHKLISSVLLTNNSIAGLHEGFSPTLKDRIELFKATGRYELRENELISKDEWISFFMGLGVVIDRQDPLIGINELAKLAELLKSINIGIIKKVAEMPNHLIFLSQFLQSKDMR